MAKIVRCDNCGKEAKVDDVLGGTPPTWIDLTEHMPGIIPNEHQQACSRKCAAELLLKPRDEATASPVPLPDVPDIPF